ncbi:sensor histidine kinase [Rubrivivax albus]|uniref:histidine kinase n=1 Tax=Rubrivivax albus TaxID=2499835 RepID=A0A437JTE5_9BURK|nr:ATP-binding protein [Rubrivivax albus]RVT50443.1 histidine kinase [Rubrivivax albus]
MAAVAPGADDSLFEASAFERVIARRPSRWIGWRRRIMMGVALAACLGLFVVIRLLVQAPALDAQWQPDPRGKPMLLATGEPLLQPFVGRRLERLTANGASLVPRHINALGAPRWTVDDQERAALVQARTALNRVLASGIVTLHFDDGSQAKVRTVPRGHAGLGVAFWLLAIPALALLLIGAVVLVAKPMLPNVLFALMTLCQSVSLLWIGVESGSTLTPVPGWLVDDLPWRLGLDLATGAAAVHAFALYPRRIAGHHAAAAVAWLIAAGTTLAVALPNLTHAWWWGQGAILALGLAALVVLTRSYAEEPNPFAMVMRRFGFAALGTMVVVNAALVAADWQPGLASSVAASAVIVWSLFFASLMALVPFLSRARRLLREFAMLAGLSTVATSLDLLFITLFSLEPFASLTLAVFIALAGYAAARQWMLDQMVGSRVMTTERTFEQLYRIAREVQKAPERRPALLSQLLRSLFDPLEVLHVPRAAPRSRVLADGSALVVPVRGQGEREPLSLVLRFSRHGRRIFTREDARLTDRIVDQLRRAVAYDQAVERGRTEERQRIAQDLHDDIGARLLTLMYKAQDPEIEDYLRHTLQDLKTLTRGLAASDHRLSHSVAEWKADIQQRLTAAHIDLDWSFAFNDDPELGVVQWSALTRVLRELVSNAIYHARATRIQIDAGLTAGVLSLRVADDGIGRNPQAWSHGLGLGGVRKRVKLLGGEVAWRENGAQGIVCEVRIPDLFKRG